MIALVALLVWAPLAGGAYRGWPLAVLQLLAVLALASWAFGMIARRRLEWRRTALDLPLGLLAILVLVQIGVGNGPLVAWALAPPSGDWGAPAVLPSLVAVGTVSPLQTMRSFQLFLTYAAVYVLVVNLSRTRAALDRLLGLLLWLGGALAFAALLDHLSGRAWLLAWSEPGTRGRLSGTFVNPDHFAVWLEMLICLGIGSVLARARESEEVGPSSGAAPSSRSARERAIRRYLPMVAIGVMGLALVFTLSRGGIVSIALALAALLVVQGLRGRARTSAVLVGLLLALVAGYGAWIGLEPLLERFRQSAYASRLVQLESTLGMFRAFPVLGVGLGAYRDIYFRYQPPELSPGQLYFPFAHNDLLQLGVELGLAGILVALWAAWRVTADLVGAHVLGRARCPVGGGERGGARRHEAGSVGVGIGALAAAFALLVHSAFDFGARIPANGVLGAACLGIATAALHTRFSGGGGRLLTALRVLHLGEGRARAALAQVAVAVIALALVPAIVRAPLVESRLESRSMPPALRVERALALAPAGPEARWARARLEIGRAREVWDSGVTADGRLLRTWAERRSEALPLFDRAVADLAVALAARPSDPYLHEALGRAQGQAAAIDDARRDARLAAAYSALSRAIALQPENPYLYRSLGGLALRQPEPRLPIALSATRKAIERDPALLPDLVTRLLPYGLTEAQWAEAVPDTMADRLELAMLLDRAGLGSAAVAEYRRAVAVSPPAGGSLARLGLARLLARLGDAQGAVGELDAAIARDPANPELLLARGSALAASGDAAGALDAYRAALDKAEARAGRPEGTAAPFAVRGAREQALAEAALGPGGRGMIRYRRALAEFLNERKLWPAAAREWQAVIAADPRDARAHTALASALGELGRPAEAIEAYRRAVALDGGAVSSRMALARSLWDTEQYHQAINEWQAVLGAEPGNLDARRRLAAAYARVGERSRAREEYRRVLAIAPGDREARQALARMGAPAE